MKTPVFEPLFNKVEGIYRTPPAAASEGYNVVNLSLHFQVNISDANFLA